MAAAGCARASVIGRCAGIGCGYTGQPGRVRAHAVACSRFAELYRSDPAAALDPEEEYRRWQADGRGAERAARYDEQVADTDARRAAMASRYVTKDLMED